jgi:hypothetical protein
VVDDGAAGTYVINTDYRVDKVTGRIFIVDGGGIAAGDTIYIDYDYKAIEYDMVKAFIQSEVKGFLRFVGDPAVGPAFEAEVWKCTIVPEGDIPFLSDDWGTINFTVTIEKDEADHPTDPYFHIIERAADFGTADSTT